MADDELAAFQAELARVEETTAAAAAATNDGAIDDGDATPEEKEFEDDDGTVYVWEPTARKFVPRGAESVPVPVPMTYSEADMVFVDDDDGGGGGGGVGKALKDAKRKGGAIRSRATPGVDVDASGNVVMRDDDDGDDDEEEEEDEEAAKKKKKLSAMASSAIEKEKDRRAKRAADAAPNVDENGWFSLKTNTSVYVDGLPDDATADEVKEVFQKCGVIKLDPDTSLPKIKLYADKATGAFKGDGLVTYLKEPSVALATTILDGTPFRVGMGTNMSVTAAKFQMKGDAYVKKQRGSKKAKRAAIAKQESALGWGGFDDTKDRKKTTAILKRMFTLDEMFSDPKFREELQEDVEAEAAKFGAVETVKVFTTNPDGAVSIRFKDPAAAEACVKAMRGRWFGGSRLEAALWDGVTNYATAGTRADESEAEMQARLDRFGASLEEEGGGGGGGGGGGDE